MRLRVLATAQATVINSRSSNCERTTFTLQGDVDDGTVIMLWLCGLCEGVLTVEEGESEGSIDDRRSMGPLFRNKRRTGGADRNEGCGWCFGGGGGVGLGWEELCVDRGKNECGIANNNKSEDEVKERRRKAELLQFICGG